MVADLLGIILTGSRLPGDLHLPALRGVPKYLKFPQAVPTVVLSQLAVFLAIVIAALALFPKWFVWRIFGGE